MADRVFKIYARVTNIAKEGQPKLVFAETNKAVTEKMWKDVTDSMSKSKHRVDRRIDGGMGFDGTLNKLRKGFRDRVIQRFYQKPSHWPDLSQAAQRVRGYLLDPGSLKEDLYKQRTRSYNKNLSWAVIDNLQFRALGLDPIMKKETPVLVQTGRLRDSFKIDFVKDPGNHRGRSTKSGRFVSEGTYRRVITFHTTSKYAALQFMGGRSTAYALQGVSKNGKPKRPVLVPHQFVPEIIAQQGALSQIGYTLIDYPIDIPARNPLYFDYEDGVILDDLLRRLGNKAERDIKKLYNFGPDTAQPEDFGIPEEDVI